MPLVVGIRFKSSGKIYYFDPGQYNLSLQDSVIVETARGPEVGVLAQMAMEMPEEKITPPLRKVIRKATPEDIQKAEQNRKRAKEAISQAMARVETHKLDMRIVDAEYAFDLSKVVFFFTAEGRVDFRELVKDLAGIFRTRVELRQIGVRDKAKMVGGLGCCGRPLCCATFLADFEPVSIKMAKEQDLSLNPLKISGVCSRLMCCLKYENEVYKERNREAKAAFAAAKKARELAAAEGGAGANAEGGCPDCKCGSGGGCGGDAKTERPRSFPPKAPVRANAPREVKIEKAYPQKEGAEKQIDFPEKKSFSERRRENPQPRAPRTNEGRPEVRTDERPKQNIAPNQNQNPEGNRNQPPRPQQEPRPAQRPPQRPTQENQQGPRNNNPRPNGNGEVRNNQPRPQNPAPSQPRPQGQGFAPQRPQTPRVEPTRSASTNNQNGNSQIPVGALVQTPEGPGKVISLRVEQKQATVLLDTKNIVEFPLHQLQKQ